MVSCISKESHLVLGLNLSLQELQPSHIEAQHIPDLTDFGNGGFLQILYHCHEQLIACDAPKVYSEQKEECTAEEFLLRAPLDMLIKDPKQVEHQCMSDVDMSDVEIMEYPLLA
ncbi:unnamed protein product [Caretta caretta]